MRFNRCGFSGPSFARWRGAGGANCAGRDVFAELFELMEQWRAAAEERGERAAVDESAREMVWILEGWGMTEEARRLEIHRAAEFEDQMMLPFA